MKTDCWKLLYLCSQAGNRFDSFLTNEKPSEPSFVCRDLCTLKHFNLRLWPLRIGFSWPKDQRLLDPNQQACVCDVCDRDTMGYWMMRDICLIFGDWMCMDLRCCLDRDILYNCIFVLDLTGSRNNADARCSQKMSHTAIPLCFFQFTEAVAERATARCWQRPNPGVRCCAQQFFVHGQRWALPQVACLQSSYTVLRQTCCKCSHEPTIEALDLPNRWEATCNGGDLSIFAWIVGLGFNGHASHLPVLKKAVLQLLPKMRTCRIIPSSYRILLLPDELHDATSPTRIWRRSLSCTLLGSRMWTEATFVPVWSETCAQPTMSMYLVVDKTTICVGVGLCLWSFLHRVRNISEEYLDPINVSSIKYADVVCQGIQYMIKLNYMHLCIFSFARTQEHLGV